MPKKTYEEYREAHMSRNRASSPDKTEDQLGREADLAAGNAVDQGWIEDRTGGPTGRELAPQVAGGRGEREYGLLPIIEQGWEDTVKERREWDSARRAEEEARRQDKLREERRAGRGAEASRLPLQVETPTDEAIFANNFVEPMDGKSVTLREVTVTPMADRGFGRSLGNKPEGAPFLTSHTPDSATLSTGQRVREGDDLDGKPGHQVTLISKVEREVAPGKPPVKDTVVEVTKPNGEPYELTYPGKEPSGVGPGAGQDWMGSLRDMDDWFPVLGASFAGADATQMSYLTAEERAEILKSMEEQAEIDAERLREPSSDAARTDTMQVSPELQSDETNAAISDAQAAVEGMLGGRVHLVSTSIGSENGRPDHVYFEEWFEDGSSQMWEYTERGPGGMPELVKARTDKGD